MGLIERLQARLELYRLEQRYTRREKRTTFISDAQYVDGEYIYASDKYSSPSSYNAPSPSSSNSASSSATMNTRRFSKMPSIVGIKEFKVGKA